MADIMLLHSVLGVREGVRDAARRLEKMGHAVQVVDLYGGKVLDDYDEASDYVDSIGGDAELLRRAVAAAAELPENLVHAGFSMGGEWSAYLGATRPSTGAILFNAAVPLHLFATVGGDEDLRWPSGVPVQVHYTAEDPFREQEMLDGFASDVMAAGAPFTLHEYPGAGHLFTDKTLPAEYDEPSAELLWQRVEAFLRSI